MTDSPKTAAAATPKQLWALSALISKNAPGMVTHSMMLGYRVAASEDEARGNFFSAVQREKPDFAIQEILCVAAAEGDMRQALGIEGAENA